MQYGTRILQLRKDSNITQQYLSKQLGISRAALSHYEKNRREPDYELLVKLADFFDVSIDYLLCRVDNKYPNKNKHVPLVSAFTEEDEILDNNIEKYLEIPPGLNADLDLAFRISENSMIWAGIHPDDIVLIKYNQNPANGMIVLVTEKELKKITPYIRYYIHQNDKTYLVSASPETKDVEVTSNHKVVGHIELILKKPTSLQQYKNNMYIKNREDKNWQKIKEKSASYGLNSETVDKILDIATKLTSINDKDKDFEQ